MDYRRLNHVLTELASYSGVKKAISGSTFVSCPYHSERTPSGRIFHSTSTRSPGFFRCYGCGQRATWDELAPRLGLRPYKYSKPQEEEAKVAVRPIEEDLQYEFEHTELPDKKKWRGITTSLLKAIGCTFVEQYGEKFIYMPVLVKGEEHGFIRARLRKVADKPSYLNKSGKWAHTHGLFPYDYAVKLMREENLNVLVLVEGPRDALRLLSARIPAVAILGTQSWTDRKAQLVELAADNAIRCFDGDDAGLQADALVKEGLDGLVKSKRFVLTGKDSPYWKFRNKEEPSKAAKRKGVDLWDPGNMPQHKLDELCQLVHSYRRSSDD